VTRDDVSNNNNNILIEIGPEDDPVVLKYVEYLWLRGYIRLTFQSLVVSRCIPRLNTKCMFRMFLTTNNYFRPKQHLQIGLCNVKTLCFL
jgi:hypothetical protein